MAPEQLAETIDAFLDTVTRGVTAQHVPRLIELHKLAYPGKIADRWYVTNRTCPGCIASWKANLQAYVDKHLTTD